MKFTPFNLLAIGLTLLFAMGKITGQLDWSWWQVFLPIFILFGWVAFFLTLMVILLVLAAVTGNLSTERKNHEKRKQELKERAAAWRAQQQPRQHREEPQSKVGGDGGRPIE